MNLYSVVKNGDCIFVEMGLMGLIFNRINRSGLLSLLREGKNALKNQENQEK